MKETLLLIQYYFFFLREEGMKLSSLLLEQYERDIASDLKKEQEDAEEEIETDSEDEYVFDIEGSDPALKEKDDRVLHLWGERYYNKF